MTLALASSLFVLLLCLAACLSALEAALHSLREQGSGAATGGSSGSERFRECLRDPQALLPEVLTSSYVLNLLLGACGLWLILHPWTAKDWNPWTSAALLLVTGLFAVEVLAQACALRSPAGTVKRMLPVFLCLRGIFSPVTARLRRIGETLAGRVTPKRLKPHQTMLAEEVETLIDMREEQGAITGDEAALLRGMVGLHGLIVKDAMTPRVDLPLMPHDAHDDEALNMLETARHRFVAVFDEKTDAIAFLLDGQRWRLAGRPHWSTLTVPPVFVPETLPLLDAWCNYLRDDSCVVVVVDEYGGFEGLLSRNSVTARLLAKAAPAPDTSSGIQPVGQNRYLVAGSTRLDEIERELEVTLEAEGVDTIGGLVMNHFGYPPKPGESLTIGSLDIKVKRTSRTRVQQLELHVNEPEDGR